MKFKKQILFVLKFIFVGSLLVFLSKKGFLSFEATRSAFAETKLILFSFIALTAATFLANYRWQVLLKAQNIHLPFLRTLELGVLGSFFNIALPGAISGDVVKAIYIGNEAPGQRAAAMGSILFDRITGISGMVLVSAFALFFSLQFEWGGQLANSLEWFIFGTAGSTLGFFLYLFFVPIRLDLAHKTLRTLCKRWPLLTGLFKIYESVLHYKTRRFSVFFSLFLSIGVHSCYIFSAIQLTHALGDTNTQALAISTVVPLALIITAIPITPAGVGTGHAAFSWLFMQIGSQRGADVFNLNLLFQFALGAIGGWIYLRFKKSTRLTKNLADEVSGMSLARTSENETSHISKSRP
jgi:uncharacterized protein (TIRG00374 family)